ncbi:alpha/beta-hydrolase [Pholiota conissans]|uniref:Alpha/beta-hydrolase n=1 Tax=Pholiota conissans TaxID=109636 RepID=A0A9P6D6Y1_9AGAR|nr:alpha/beta-hydrolase [Pholiota conissans]
MPPFSNALTREVGLKVGPTVLEVLVKHYFDRLKADNDTGDSGATLKQDNVLYHEAFTIVKNFLAASTFHTIEELQSFSNTRTPSPPWTHVVRVFVPLVCCDEAALYLIKALGGDEVAKRLIGGVKWWQVRGINGVDGQWITARKDYQEAKRRHKMKHAQDKQSADKGPDPPLMTEDPSSTTGGAYEKDMDAMRCILYLHGGGYYFGSVDQERYSIQRMARKINGRVFAINYRLAPQYPFPCALHDALAAYLFLIRPPPGAAHQAVDPKHIVISGDSAGGGLSLALLQVIRDSDLPSPAGGILISPWCDLTHSFPSVHTNTNTDVIPESGLSFHKPSLLWPPPSEEISSRVHASIRFRIRQVFRSEEPHPFNPASTYTEGYTDITGQADLSTPMAEVSAPINLEKVVAHDSVTGEKIEVNQQLQFYTRNSLLVHPLVSPVMSYLGGLPPLLFIVGDKEVLRDEILYTAHKAAYPEKYPISDRVRSMYPVFRNIEERSKPTPVHLQVYDESPHILPILFAFTTPAKFCFRGMATFTKFVTKMPLVPPPTRKGTSGDVTNGPITRRQSMFAGFKPSTKRHTQPPEPTSPISPPIITLTESPSQHDDTPKRRHTIRRALSATVSHSSSFLRRSRSPSPISPSTSFLNHESRQEGEIPRSESPKPGPEVEASRAGIESPIGEGPASPIPLFGPLPKPSAASSDVGGPRFQLQADPSTNASGTERFAGEPFIYSDISEPTEWPMRMIRERVSTAGVLRALEPLSEIPALQVPTHEIGIFNKETMARYLRDRRMFQNKFAHTSASLDKKRHRALERAKKDTIHRLARLRQALHKDGNGADSVGSGSTSSSGTSAPGWGWAWALEEGEDPPPSSIVSRRDTEEARKLAEVADEAVLGPDHAFSGNNLWAVVINFLTVTPGRENRALVKKRGWRRGHGKEKEKAPETENPDGAVTAGEESGAGSAGGTEAHSTSESGESVPRTHLCKSSSKLATMKLWHRHRKEPSAEAKKSHENLPA